MMSMGKPDGVVRVVFATMAPGMGVNFSVAPFTTELRVLWTIISRSVVEQEEEVSSQHRLSTGLCLMFLCDKTSVTLAMLK